MRLTRSLTTVALGAAIALAAPVSGALAHDHHHEPYRPDFGETVEKLLAAQSEKLFGVKASLKAESTESVDAATAEADPLSLVTLARGLRARVVASSPDLGPNIDMMALWPPRHPTHIIACNEQGPSQVGVQRVRLSDGMVETILTGTQSCDPMHATAWGTVVFGEEAGSSGTVLEMIDPLHTTGVVYDRGAGTFSGADAANVTERAAIGHLSFEGLMVYPNGVMYYGDENRPSMGTPGGAYFKFVPDHPWNGGAPIGSLDDSPLAGGSVYGLSLGLRNGGTDYGQGTETGLGTWVPIAGADDGDLRAAAADLFLTGYYRPEDGNVDLHALAKGDVRFCANNTGNEEDDRSWGNTICVTDGTLAEATANTATPEVRLFQAGTFDRAMVDNIAYEPRRGNWVLQTDRDSVGLSGDGYPFNNSIWMCLEDGADVDDRSDGCIRIINLNDLNAESTGGFFDAYGRHYYFSVQHNVTGHGTILDVTGWR
jgi:hypothetical protein